MGPVRERIKFVGYPIVPGFDFSDVSRPSASVDNLRARRGLRHYVLRGLLVAAARSRDQCRKTPKALSAAEAAALPPGGRGGPRDGVAQFWPPRRRRGTGPCSCTPRPAASVHARADGEGAGLRLLSASSARRLVAGRAGGADTVVCKAGRSGGTTSPRRRRRLRAIFGRTAFTLRNSYDAPAAQTGRLVIFGFHTNLTLVDVEPLHWLRMARHGVCRRSALGPRALLQVDPRLTSRRHAPLFFVFASMAWRWTRRRDASQVLRRRDGFGRRVHGAAPRVGGRGPTPRRARRDFWIRGTAGGARADPGRPVRREDRL